MATPGSSVTQGEGDVTAHEQGPRGSTAACSITAARRCPSTCPTGLGHGWKICLHKNKNICARGVFSAIQRVAPSPPVTEGRLLALQAPQHLISLYRNLSDLVSHTLLFT